MFKSYTPNATQRVSNLLTGKRRLRRRKLALLARKSPESNCGTTGVKSSTGTLVDHVSVSPKLNCASLKLAVRKVHSREPKQLLKRIFRTPRKLSVETSATPRLKSSELKPPPRRGYCDSTFSHGEANKIMRELTQIRSPKVWKEVLNGFQTRPGLLLDLIPLRTPRPCHGARKFRFPSAEPQSKFLATRTPGLQEGSPAQQTETITPEEVEILHSNNQNLTEDWKRSLLNFNLQHTAQFVCSEGLGKDELREASVHFPRTPSGLEKLRHQAMLTLELLLEELLGTQSDVTRFRKRYAESTPSRVKALISKCLDMFTVRELTAELLLVVHQREQMLSQLHTCEGSTLKKCILGIYDLNKVVRNKIEHWLSAEMVPFDCFYYGGQSYIDKMTEDNVLLQARLAQL